MKGSGSFNSALPDTHPIWEKITNPVSIGGAPTPPTVRENGTDATAASSLIVDGGTDN